MMWDRQRSNGDLVCLAESISLVCYNIHAISLFGAQWHRLCNRIICGNQSAKHFDEAVRKRKARREGEKKTEILTKQDRKEKCSGYEEGGGGVS